MQEITKLRKLLHDYSLVILKNNKVIYKSEEQGVIPIINALDNIGKEKLRNSLIGDRIVGKAAALLFSLIKPRLIYALIMSKQAMSFLDQEGISYLYDVLVENILNKEKTDICPFEKILLNINDPQEAYKIIKNKIKNVD